MKIKAKQVTIHQAVERAENIIGAGFSESKNAVKTIALQPTKKKLLEADARCLGKSFSAHVGNIVDEYYALEPELDLVHEILPFAEAIKNNKKLVFDLLETLSK